VFEHLGQIPDLTDERPKPLVIGVARSFDHRLFSHGTDGREAIVQRDQPVPDLRIIGVDGDQNFVAIERRFGDVIAHMTKHRAPHRKLRRLLEVEQPTERATESAGVERESCFDAPQLALLVAYGYGRAGVTAFKGDHFFAKHDVCALGGSTFRQRVIEDVATHLKRRGRTRCALVRKVDGRVHALLVKGGPILELKADRFDVREQSRFFEKNHRLRQQALADGEARKMPALHHFNRPTFAHQHRCGNRAGRAGADDHDVCGGGMHGENAGGAEGEEAKRRYR